MLTLKSIQTSLYDFFLAPRPTEGIALFRILWCTLLLFRLALDIPDLMTFYGTDAVLSLEGARLATPGLRLNLFAMIGDGSWAVGVLALTYGVSLVSAIVGYQTRVSLLVAFVCLASFQHRNVWILSSWEPLLRTVTFLLISSPCGNTLSVDSVLGRTNPKFHNPSDAAPWVWRLLQLQFSAVFFCAFLAGLKGNEWFDGSALYYATRIDRLKTLSLPSILDSVLALKGLTWFILGLQFALGVLIWVKELKRPLILAGIILHAFLFVLFSRPVYDLAIVVLLFTFVSPEECRRLVRISENRLREALSSSKLPESLKSRLLSLC